ncbi:MAG TPA: DinB family protein [Thermoanaerobaculia bacterium]|nr:DinB family protein [Thermoanaerobaculia bacterium]
MDDTHPLLQRLKTQLSALPAVLAGIAEKDLQAPVGGRWSAAENVAHLARHTDLTLERIERILAEDAPSFAPYRAERDPEWPAWLARPLEDNLARLNRSRAALVARARSLTEADLARIGRHERFGPLTLAAWLEFYLAHEGHHLYVIFKRARGVE